MSDVIIPGEKKKPSKATSKAPDLKTPLTFMQAFLRGRKYALEGQQRGLDQDMKDFLAPTTKAAGPLSTINKALIGGLDVGARVAEEVEAAGMGVIRAIAEDAKRVGIVDDADRLAGEAADIGMVSGITAGMTPVARGMRRPAPASIPRVTPAAAVDAITERRQKKGIIPANDHETPGGIPTTSAEAEWDAHTKTVPNRANPAEYDAWLDENIRLQAAAEADMAGISPNSVGVGMPEISPARPDADGVTELPGVRMRSDNDPLAQKPFIPEDNDNYQLGLSEFARDGNDRFLMYRDENGEQANIHVKIDEEGRAEVSVDPFSKTPNRFGPASVRAAFTQLREMYPEIKSVYGTRESGANPGRIQTINPEPGKDTGPSNPNPPGRGGGDGLDDPANDNETGRRTGMDRQQLLTEAKRLGVDTSNIAELNELDRLVKFHSEMRGDVNTRALALEKAAKELHEDGTLPLTVGTRVLTPKGKELGQGPWKITGYFVNPKDPTRNGYRVTRATDDPDWPENSVLLVNDPKRDPEMQARVKKDIEGWQVMSGPKGETGKDSDNGGTPPGAGGGDGLDGPPEEPSVAKTGSIGPSQDAMPDELRGMPLPKQPGRSKGETRKAGNRLGIRSANIGAKGRIGDVAAIAERTKQISKATGEEYLRRLTHFGGDSKEAAQALDSWVRSTLVHNENASNLGRGLSSLNDGLSAKDSARLLKASQDPKLRDRVAELVKLYSDDPKMMEKVARDIVDPTMRDRIFSFRYNMMLSGPKTHVYNILGTSSNLVVDLAEHGVAALGGQFKRLTGNSDRVYGQEVAARIVGAVMGAKVGLKTMRQAYKEGRPLDDTDRTEMDRGRVSSWEVPVKALAAEDEFFRAVADMSDIYGMAVREARKEGLTGTKLRERINELIQKPTKAMEKNAKEYAKRMRFQDDPSKIGQAIERLRNADTKDSIYGKRGADTLALILPFVRTPDSLLRTAVRRSPLGFGEKVNQDGLKKGGADRDLALSRMAMGTGVATYIMLKAIDGDITGEGPADYKKREAMPAKWQPNSFRGKDGEYYSYQGAEPLSILLSSIATMKERAEDTSGEDLATQGEAIVKGLGNSLSNQSWLEGLQDLFEAFDESAQGGSGFKSWMANIAQSFTVPAITRQINQTYFDPVQRDTRGDDSMADRVLGRIQTGIPGMSDELPPQRDALGREKGKGETLGPDILSRMTSSGREETPVSAELERLRQLDPDKKPIILPLQRTITAVDFPLGRLNAKEHSHYQGWFGSHFNALMDDALAAPGYKELTDEEKVELVRDLAAEARAYALEDAFDPEKDK